VLPTEHGILVHTNHFVDPRAAGGDLEPTLGPDSLVRYDVLRRRLVERPALTPEAVVAAMRSHLGGAGAICCHPDPESELGHRYTTLATVTVDVASCRLVVRAGGPCAESAAVLDTSTATREAPWAPSL
jgi:isopenicillin-N N-acyltransferase-like protein